ncbi:hypothetical protein CLOM_g3152 [Closterium sp. NIES-68]|nr:hypothetical protein CLOM_g3152 [Closterium sp. NIES-68]
MSFSQIPVSDGTGSKTLMLSAHLNVSANVFNPNDNTMVVEQLFVAIDGMQHPMDQHHAARIHARPQG